MSIVWGSRSASQHLAEAKAWRDEGAVSLDEELEYWPDIRKDLEFPSFTDEIAFRLGCTIRANYIHHLQHDGKGIVISISLFDGHTLFACSVGPGTGPDNWEWISRKNATVKRFGIPTWIKGRQLLKAGKNLDSLGPDYAAHGGAVPIYMMDLTTGPIGTVTVSGLTQKLDHELVLISMANILSELTGTAATTTTTTT